MSDTASPPVDSEPEIAYRSFNSFSLVAFIFAILSLLTIANFAFLFAALLGCLIGILAMRSCDEGRAYTGYHLARMAVFLSVAGAVMGLSHHFGRVAWLTQIARGHANTIVQAIHDDRLEEVFCFATEPSERPVAGTDLDRYYESTQMSPGVTISPVGMINIWMSVAPIRGMAADRLEGRHEYVGFEGFRAYRRVRIVDEVKLRYRYVPASPDLQPFDYLIGLNRYRYPTEVGYQWQGRPMSTGDQTGEPMQITIRGSSTPRQRFKSAPPNPEPAATEPVYSETVRPNSK